MGTKIPTQHDIYQKRTEQILESILKIETEVWYLIHVYPKDRSIVSDTCYMCKTLVQRDRTPHKKCPCYIEEVVGVITYNITHYITYIII